MNNQSQSPFVVQQLRPSNPNGQSTATYELTKASVSPVRLVGRDARGMPVEDTVPTAAKWGNFLMVDGCINKVPLRTGAVPSMHADALAYENETLYDLIVAGCIPAWLCPYSTKFSYITQGPFASPPAGVGDCGGSDREGGCEHLRAIAEIRKAEVLRIHNLESERFAAQRDEEYSRMRSEIVEGVGQAIAKHVVSPQAARAEGAKRLRDGKGEVEG